MLGAEAGAKALVGELGERGQSGGRDRETASASMSVKAGGLSSQVLPIATTSTPPVSQLTRIRSRPRRA